MGMAAKEARVMDEFDEAWAIIKSNKTPRREGAEIGGAAASPSGGTAMNAKQLEAIESFIEHSLGHLQETGNSDAAGLWNGWWDADRKNQKLANAITRAQAFGQLSGHPDVTYNNPPSHPAAVRARTGAAMSGEGFRHGIFEHTGEDNEG